MPVIYFGEHGITIDSTGVRSAELNLGWPEIHSYGSQGFRSKFTVTLNSQTLIITTEDVAERIISAISEAKKARQ